MKKAFKNGFTLTELVAAMVVIGMVIAITLPITLNKMKKVDNISYYLAYKTMVDINSNITSQQEYYTDNIASAIPAFKYLLGAISLGGTGGKGSIGGPTVTIGNYTCKVGTCTFGKVILDCDDGRSQKQETVDCDASCLVKINGTCLLEASSGGNTGGEDGKTPNPGGGTGSGSGTGEETTTSNEGKACTTDDGKSGRIMIDTDDNEECIDNAILNNGYGMVLCNEIGTMYNIKGDTYCDWDLYNTTEVAKTGDFSSLTPHVTLTNGLKIYIGSEKISSIPKLAGSSEKGDRIGFIVYVDINGNSGKSMLYSDVFPFYLTISGKTIPGYSSMQDAGATSTDQMSVSVMYDDYTSGNRAVKVLMKGVDYRQAACASGVVTSTTYCKATSTGKPAVSKDSRCKPEADCRIIINKPFKIL